MTDDDDEPEFERDELETAARAEALVQLRRMEALLASGRASGLIIIAVNADGFVSATRSLPGTREAYSEATMMLDYLSALTHERWADLTLVDNPGTGTGLFSVDSSPPEPT